MIALQKYTAQQVKAKIVSEKWGLRIKDKFLGRWKKSLIKASKINRLCSILQQQNYLKFIKAFMVKLEDASHYMVFKKVLDKKLQGKALQVLKQNWLLSKMSTSLLKKHD